LRAFSATFGLSSFQTFRLNLFIEFIWKPDRLRRLTLYYGKNSRQDIPWHACLKALSPYRLEISLLIQEKISLHALESILARHSDRKSVSAGDLITINVDIAGVNDLYVQVIDEFKRMGGKKVWDPRKVVFFFDHYSPPSTIQASANQQTMRKFCFEQGIDKLYDIHSGVCHRVLFDHGHVCPGSTIVITDSHTTTHGAFGAFSTGVGATDMAAILLTGKMWVKVPEVVRVALEGSPLRMISAKDLILHVLGKIRADGAVYKAIEFTGPATYNLSLEQRAVLANMSVEMGAKAAFIEKSAAEAWETHGAHAPQDPPYHRTSEGYTYAESFSFNVSELSPQIALPGSVDNVVDVADVAGVPIDQAYVGGCTGGSVEDMAATARQLSGRTVAPRVRLVVSPASRAVYLQALREGYIESIVQSGGTIINPGCGPCLGVHQGILSSGEVCISAASRNFPGRMGSPEAQIYLASPATAAASAVAGEITLPREISCPS